MIREKMSLSPSAEIYDNYTGDKNHKTDLYKYMQEYEAKQWQTTQNGGFLGLFESGIGKYLSDAKKSERALVKSHQKMSNTIAEWTKNYEKHLANLSKLDEFMHTGESLQTVFKEILMKNYFRKFGEKIDTSIPLFLHNYIADKDSTPNDFKREHVEKQIWYVLRTEFGPVEAALIKYIEIRILDDEKIQVKFRTVENKPHERTIHHKDLNIDISGTKQALGDILKSAKGDMSFNINEIKKKEPPAFMVKPSASNEALQQYFGRFNVNLTKKNVNIGSAIHNSTLYQPQTKKNNGKNVASVPGANNKKELQPHEKEFDPYFGMLDRQKAEALARKEANEKKLKNEAEAKAKIEAELKAKAEVEAASKPPNLMNIAFANTKNIGLPDPVKTATVEKTIEEIKQTPQFGPADIKPAPFPMITNELQTQLTPSVLPSVVPSVVPSVNSSLSTAPVICFSFKSKEECNKHSKCEYLDKAQRCHAKPKVV
jgi:hypothetical protein